MNQLETEVKFAVEDLAEIRSHLISMDADRIQERTLELNLRFDDKGGSLYAGGRVLRLRRDTRYRLTLKLPAGPWNDRVKTLRELEVEVSDFETTLQMLDALGYRECFRYEKYRESYRVNDVEICLDELPFGCYVEIEGAPPAIDRLALRLELANGSRIVTGYYTLYEEARQRFGLDGRDCTFDSWRRALKAKSKGR